MIETSRNSRQVKYAVRDIVLVAQEAQKRGLELRFLNIGDPNKFDHVTPPHLIEAAHRAMLNNQTGYGPSSGTDEAIDAIRQDAQKSGIKNIQDIFVTVGAGEAIEIVLTALLNPEDNILTPSPVYPLYSAVQSKLGVKENTYYLDEKNNWMPDPHDIRKKINDRTKAILIINPNNPTGSVCSREILLEIADIADKHNLLVLCDEVYGKLVYKGCKHIPLASLNDNLPVATFNSLSKAYIAPGFRTGWGIISGSNKKLHNLLEVINQLLRARICSCTPINASVKAALLGPQDHLDRFIDKLEKRKNITVDILNNIEGIHCNEPQAAFYAYPEIDVKDDMAFIRELILNTGVVVVPGSGFGQKPGTSHFRTVYLPPEDTLTEAYNLIGEFMKRWRNRK
ncbi:MAG: aminotransferase class I/II-fold pyridoxal phosphate-dependent enzyme [Oligoflexia bacterium]|nr:aminotransferase class I/II-fold pyridoxal phosphate-dependent enzyme [Oligoflexia bacterium]